MLAKARRFFLQRQILEADVPALSQNAPIDEHIEVLQTLVLENRTGYLFTSPEYGLKRLLSEGLGDLYQLSHVFRFGEKGRFHKPEFTMVEWYRQNCTYEFFLNELVGFIRLFLGPLKLERSSYRKTFLQYTEMDYLQKSAGDLYRFALKKKLPLSEGAENWPKDTLLNLITSTLIEPHLGLKKLFVLEEYPASQAALAKTKITDGVPVAERFEVYYRGLELANGYHELRDEKEQRKRLIEANQKRQAAGKAVLPLDENFLSALKKGLPECYGVAAGFDRLLMLRLKQKDLKAVLSFAFEDA
jgi:lysyl-tRNA synthetase class 2